MLVPLTVAIITRLSFIISPDVIYNDSIVYIKAAEGILLGKWSETIVPPLYPALVAGGKLLMGDFERAGIMVSLVFGTLLFVPVFYLGRELYNERVGLIAALLAAVQPCLLRYSGAVLTESIYYFMVALSAFLALKAYTTGKALWIVSLSLTIVLAYLTRPEALGFLLVFMGWVLLVRPATGNRSILKRLSIVLLSVLCFIVFSSPYLLVLRKELGRWELSKKAYVTAGTKDADAAKTGLSESRWRPRRISPTALVKDPLSLATLVGRGAIISFYKFQTALNPVLFLLAIWGFTRRKENSCPLSENFLLLSFILFFFCLVFPYFKMSARYSSHMIPIALPWVANGFIAIGESLPRYDRVRTFFRKRIGSVLLAVIIVLFIQATVEGDREHRQIQKEIGLWLKQYGHHGEKLMSSRVHEAFYAGMELVRYRDDDLQSILDASRSMPVRYVIIDDEMEKSHPDFQEKIEAQGLMPLRSWKQGKGKIWIFENARLVPVRKQATE